MTRVIRACAAFDLVATGLLAWPPLAHGFLRVLYAVNGVFGGTADAPVLAPLAWFFVNLAGALGVLWAIVRLRWPLPVLGRADALARIWVAGLVVFHVIGGAPGVLLLFVVSELAGAVVQLAARVPTAPRAW